MKNKSEKIKVKKYFCPECKSELIIKNKEPKEIMYCSLGCNHSGKLKPLPERKKILEVKKDELEVSNG